jgi:hypothetical protein
MSTSDNGKPQSALSSPFTVSTLLLRAAAAARVLTPTFRPPMVPVTRVDQADVRKAG